MLENLFNPRAVAVVGASSKVGKVGHSLVQNIIENGYAGEVYPVNPKSDNILGKKCYPEIKSLPDGVDLAVIAIPAKLVPGAIEECGTKGIKAAVVISAGFKEVGDGGADLEKCLFNAAMVSGVRILGPNCLGFINTQSKLDASFAANYPDEGNIAVISQSGAICTAMLDWAASNSIGFSKLISFGNKVDIDEELLIETLGDDEETKVIVGYLENINDGPMFMRTAEKVTKKKPIILIKAGTTSAGAQAASSHTGSIAGAKVAYECAFHSSGVLRAPSLEALFDYAQIFSYQPLPRGDRVAVITNAGGPGIMTADAIENMGLSFAVFDDKTKEELASFLPSAANVNNPVDILGDAPAEVYQKAMEVVLSDEAVDAVVVLLSPQAMVDCAKVGEIVVGTAAKFDKPVVSSFIGGERVSAGIKVLQAGKVPHYPTPERAVDSIKRMVDYAEWLKKPPRIIRRFSVNTTKVDRVIHLNRKRGQLNIGEQDAKEVLTAYGFTTPLDGMARNADEAVAIASRIGYPIVMKIVSPDIVHKSDVGGVKVGLSGPGDVRDAYELMLSRIAKHQPDARLNGVLVQEMVNEGREIIIGMTRDPQFGPMLMFGLGGIYVEVLRDVSFQLAPITAEDAMHMLMGTKTYKLLMGVRGQGASDMQLVAECIQRISQLSMDFPMIEELDINPLKVSTVLARAIAVDARIKISQ